MMLSRVAESLYWMERYLERADNTARFIEVSKSLSLDFQNNESLWSSLIMASGNNELYKKSFDSYIDEDVIFFLTFDSQNPNSILKCLEYARNNARSIREVLSNDLWEVINEMYSELLNKSHDIEVRKEPQELIHELKLKRMTFMGIMNNSLLMTDADHLAVICRFL